MNHIVCCVLFLQKKTCQSLRCLITVESLPSQFPDKKYMVRASLVKVIEKYRSGEEYRNISKSH